MALPTSTIILGLLTAVPFGLAIKDTVQGKSFGAEPGDGDHDGGYTGDEELDGDAARRQAEYERERAAEDERITSAVKKLIDPSKVDFRLAPIGSPYAIRPEADLAEVRRASGARTFEIGSRNDRVNRVHVELPHSSEYSEDVDRCDALRTQMGESWGSSQTVWIDDDVASVWVGPTARAVFTDHDRLCTLVIEPQVGPSAWVGGEPTAIVPLWALGQPASKLIEQLGADAYSSKTEIRWTAPGIGFGAGETELYAAIAGGKIVTITAKTRILDETYDTIVARLVDLYGPAKDGDMQVSWQKPRLVLHRTDANDRALLVAGKPLPEGVEGGEAE